MEAIGAAEVEREGGGKLRAQLALAAITGRDIAIRRIREKEQEPGLRAHELLLLRMVEHVSSGTSIDISPTGTSVRMRPGALTGTQVGQSLDVREGERSVSFYLEPLLLMGCLSRFGITFSLIGVTFDAIDPPATPLSYELTRLLNLVGVAAKVEVIAEAFHPQGAGEVRVFVPPADKTGIPKPMDAVDVGLFRRIRGGATSSRCANAAKQRVREMCPDTLVRGGAIKKATQSSPGVAAYVFAESTAGKCIAAGYALPESHDGRMERQPPEDVGERASKELLHTLQQGGCVGPACQALAAHLCAIGPAELARVRMGPLTNHLVNTLRELQAVAGVTFQIEEDPEEPPSVLLSTVGLGVRSVARRAR